MIYTKLSENLQNKTDICIIKNIKFYKRFILFKELDVFHKNKLIGLYFDYYTQFNIRYDIPLNYRDIENDILFWLNDPHSRNYDTPFMSGEFSRLVMDILYRIFTPHEISYIISFINTSFHDYYYENKNTSCIYKIYSSKYIINKIIHSLTLYELESLYIYTMKNIGKCVKDNIMDITLNFNCSDFTP